MKRSYIWCICVVIGVSFLALLYLQSRYATAIVRMRRQQFEENVFRSLDMASRDLEKAETFRMSGRSTMLPPSTHCAACPR